MRYWIGELILAIFLMALALVFYVYSAQFPASMNPDDLGPAAFPRLMAGLVLLLGVAQIVLSCRERKQTKIKIPNKVGLVLGIILMFLYVFLMTRIGYFYTTPVFIFVLLGLLGNRRWGQMALVSAAFTAMAYLVFYKFLMVSLPL
jgi:putative tricarboxylic transport membrane protein